MKQLLLLLSLGVFLFSCGDDDNDGTDNGVVSPTSIEGKWTVDKIEFDIVADKPTTSEEVKSKLNTTGVYLKLQYIPVEKSYEFDFNFSGGEAWFKDNILTTNSGLKFELINGRFYKEQDFTESYKTQYPDLQKVIQKLWLKK